ncbi:MAG: AAA family ATPase [Acidimicrobiales bacterium]|nr:AAA family ATPase [Acidimicrobiales bacterium]
MARSHAEGAERIYALHRRWLGEVLSGTDSLFTPGKAVWTADNLTELELGFIERPDLTAEKRYLEKLKDQLSDLSPEAIQLMAEIHLIHFLMIWHGAISAATKRSQVETILSWMPEPVAIPEEVAAALAPGMANPGQYALTRRDVQIAWLIRFSQRVVDAGDAQELVADPWALRSATEAVDSPEGSTDFSRLAVQHLAHPETFERMVVEGHRTLVLRRFASLAPAGIEDPDRRLLAIREVLTPQYGTDFEYYDPRLAPLWRKDEKKWSAFVAWCERFHAMPTFDEAERTYKLEAIERMAAGKRAWQEQREGWPDAVAKGFRNANNNLTLWRSHGEFAKWVLANPDDGAAALEQVWSAAPVSDRLDAFADALPDDLVSTLGERLNIGSYLVMADDPHRYPPVKVSLFRSCWRITGWPLDAAGESPGSFYERVLVFCDELILASESWAFPLRDRLDAQSVAWAFLNTGARPPSFTEGEWDDLLAFRASKGVAPEVDDEEEEPVEPGTTTPPEPGAWTDELTRRRLRYASVLPGWLDDDEAQARFTARVAARAGAQALAVAAVDALTSSNDLQAFGLALGDGAFPQQTRQGSHRTFVAHVAKHAGADPAVAAAMAEAYRAPANDEEARSKIEALSEAIAGVPGIAGGYVSMVPAATSVFWSLQDAAWAPLWASTEDQLRQLGWHNPPATPGDRYLTYLDALRNLEPATPDQPLDVLRWWNERGYAPLDPSAIERAQQNRQLARRFHEAGGEYPDQESLSAAEVNARSSVGDLRWFGQAWSDEVADALDDDVAVVVPQLRYRSNLPYRMDAFVGWRVPAVASSPSLRLWVTPDRVVAGLHPGKSGSGWFADAGARVLPVVPDGMGFFTLDASEGEVALRPTADPAGEWLVGRELTPGELGSSEIGSAVVDVAARLRPVLEALDSSATQEVDPTPIAGITGDFDHLDAAASDLLVDRAHLDEIRQLLEDKGQVILYGPPGTGKTYLAKRLARALAEDDRERYAIVQFHPATTYEDFVEGLRPKLTDAKQVTYDIEHGPLMRMAGRAATSEADHVLVIDEINRANLPKVLGELLFLLEYREEAVHTLYRPEEAFKLPSNLKFIGTMNTADRSIALIDAAMRRRFHFIPFFPDQGMMEGLLDRWLDRHQRPLEIATFVASVNAELRAELGDHLLLGPSFFMKSDLSEPALEKIWRYNVYPFLEEQFWGRDELLAAWQWPEVRRRHYEPARRRPDQEDDTSDG